MHFVTIFPFLVEHFSSEHNHEDGMTSSSICRTHPRSAVPVPWCGGESAIIAAIPAPNSPLVELALCPVRAAESIGSFSEVLATKFLSLEYKELSIKFLVGQRTPTPPIDHHWQSAFLSEPSLKTFGSSGAFCSALRGASNPQR